MKKMSLRPQEAELLKLISSLTGKATIDTLAKHYSGGHVSVDPVAEWLREKLLLNIQDHTDKFITLTVEGEKVAKEGFPERIILSFLLTQKSSKSPMKSVKDTVISQLDSNGFNAGLGWLRRKKWGSISKGQLEALITDPPDKGPDELLLTRIQKDEPIALTTLSTHEQSALEILAERKGLIDIQTKTEITLILTPKAKQLLAKGLQIKETITKLTPDLIRSGNWKNVAFQPFDIQAPVAPIYPGKIHPFYQVLRQIRRVFLDLGFTEIRGPLIEPAFWVFDALFQPQDHPARELQDTFYLKTPSTGTIPEKTYVDQVRQTHENGWTTGSRGWGGQWDESVAKRLVLRAHTTSTTINHLANNPEAPQKVFSIDRVFRNEKIDYKHLAEFHQIEGVIMDEDVTLRDLKGILTTFYNKMGFEKVPIWPSFFPYTEPSLQSSVYVPKIGKWLELSGMGVFRPEVTKPLGIKHPVLAWGGGLERLVMLAMDLTDIRDIYRNDLNLLRRTPSCQ